MITFEVCCGSFSDACRAQEGGADRIELNSALSIGGLTPDIGSVLACREKITIPVIAMVRPRGGGFCYTEEEYQVMQKTAGYLLEAGMDGLAFGFLKENGEVDQARTKTFVDLIHSYGKEAVFHRAFDCTKNPAQAAETLIESGIDRILSSGAQQTAMQGAQCLKELQDAYGQEIEFLAGSGIRSENVSELIKKTGIHQVHSSCKGYGVDKTARSGGVAFDYPGLLEWYHYELVSKDEVQKMKQALQEETPAVS